MESVTLRKLSTRMYVLREKKRIKRQDIVPTSLTRRLSKGSQKPKLVEISENVNTESPFLNLPFGKYSLFILLGINSSLHIYCIHTFHFRKIRWLIRKQKFDFKYTNNYFLVLASWYTATMQNPGNNPSEDLFSIWTSHYVPLVAQDQNWSFPKYQYPFQNATKTHLSSWWMLLLLTGTDTGVIVLTTDDRLSKLPTSQQICFRLAVRCT